MSDHVCPWWIGYFLICPARRLFQNPVTMLSPYIKNGMTTMDLGCGMGYHSLDMARMAGLEGKVVCVDLQEKMIRSLVKRATKAGLIERIEHRVCTKESLGIEDLAGQVDFALAANIVHEVPDAQKFFEQVYPVMKPEGTLLVSEPKGHVSKKSFQKTIAIAQEIGFKSFSEPRIARSISVEFKCS